MKLIVPQNSSSKILVGLLLVIVCGTGFFLITKARGDKSRSKGVHELRAEADVQRDVERAAEAVIATGDTTACDALPIDIQVNANGHADWDFPRRFCYEIALQRTKNPDLCAARYLAEPGNPEAWWLDQSTEECYAEYGALGQSEQACLRVTDGTLREKCLYRIEGIETIPDASAKPFISHPDLHGNFYAVMDGDIATVRVAPHGTFSTVTLLDLPYPVTSLSINPARTLLLFTGRKDSREADSEIQRNFGPATILGYYDLRSHVHKILYDAEQSKGDSIADIDVPIFDVGDRAILFTAGTPKKVSIPSGSVTDVFGFTPLGSECVNSPRSSDPTGTAVAISYSCTEGGGTKVLDRRNGKVLLDVYSYIEGESFCGFVEDGAYAVVKHGWNEESDGGDTAIIALTVKAFDGSVRDNVFERVRPRIADLFRENEYVSCHDLLRAGGYEPMTPSLAERDTQITIESDSLGAGILWFREPKTNNLKRLVEVDIVARTSPGTTFYANKSVE